MMIGEKPNCMVLHALVFFCPRTHRKSSTLGNDTIIVANTKSDTNIIFLYRKLLKYLKYFQ